MVSLSKIGENRLIERLTRILPATDARVIAGIGDDCAVVRVKGCSEDWLLTSDPVIEGIHFLPGTEPEAIGHKAAGRVLSDLAAMGGKPAFALIDLVAPASTSVKRIEGI